MTDLYSELLVKKEQTVKDQAIKILLIFFIVFTAIAGLLLTPLAWVLTIALGVAAYFVMPLLDLEYEYVFVNGELDIDRIASKSKRKRMKSFDLAKMEIMAPVNSHRMDYQNHNTNMKVLDFSSGNSQHKIFAMIIPDEKDVYRVLLEPDKELLDNIARSCPRKVFLD
ncbi:MAG TPA: hypothetical protein H9935_10815 [Candidatus Blautia merdigallinarum]|uniref:Uncharacterized protein n=1 Tax=Candidatus Blautia merdigallinarum TaxID=2838495 RepID=A0A9D2SKE4_9FIRM|nr:hypothetical protein [Candidatus Blautia merdigallinarum]